MERDTGKYSKIALLIVAIGIIGALACFKWAATILIILFVLAAILLIGVVLLQNPHESGGGMASIFGGGGVDSPFGAKTATAVTKITGVLAILLMALAVAIAFNSKL